MRHLYIPSFEIILFVVVSTSCLFLNIHPGLIAVLIISAYLFVLAPLNIIQIKNGKLRITYLNPFQRTHLIDIKNIISVKSNETFQNETVITGESYMIFNRTYNVEYLNDSGKNKSVRFKVNNQKKERLILNEMKKFIQHNQSFI